MYHIIDLHSCVSMYLLPYVLGAVRHPKQKIALLRSSDPSSHNVHPLLTAIKTTAHKESVDILRG
jgi:hypothetical protein